MQAKLITPNVTALTEDGHVDLEGNASLYEAQIEAGIDGILILGSIGEFFAIPKEEKLSLIEQAVKTIDGRTPLIVGTNEMNVEECIALSNTALEMGADAVMVISPYYFSLSEKDVFSFYDELAEQVNGPIYLYNFPARTGYDLSPNMVKELALKHPNIVGIKDTTGLMEHTRQLIRMIKPVRPDFEILSGFDEFFAHNVLSGGDGCIAGIANFAPEVCVSFVDAVKAEDFQKMQSQQKKIDELMPIYSIGPQFIPIIKQAMIERGRPMTGDCTKPIGKATEEQTRDVQELLKMLYRNVSFRDKA